ncbi:MAG: YggS family pyridoxal phosphate-dependent enzyme [Muribaculaceae bacterium]|nr:YggS family pyridoxal phosphate-dependent enzyme [Muribaculaceae bacterium]
MIAERIRTLHEELPAGVELVAVSKFHPVDALMQAYDAGQRRFGESRVQELIEKIPQMPADVKWHFIGHLQTNKVRHLVGKCEMIESVDSDKLLELIDRESERAGVVSRVLMQVHVAKEETKFGFLPEELLSWFKDKKFEALKATHICGVMGMASNTDDMNRVGSDFAEIRRVFDEILAIPDLNLRGFDTVSMGMSGDWPLAVEHGSNLVRVGTYIFGPREY